jgi:atypical dual specificity phosphatase
LRNFCFIIEGKLAGMGRPGVFGSLDEDLAELRGQGIGALVTLTHEELNPDALRKARLESLHLPVCDFSVPTPDQIDRFVDFVDRMNDRGVGVVVHCGTGSGRAGTMLACYLVSRGHSAEDAIKEIRRKRSSYIETREQEDAVRLYAERLGRKKSTSE